VRYALALLASLWAAPALAVLPHEMLADPALEARARVVGQELRCLVCQNQPIDDSNAPLAADLRRLVRERIAKGDSNEAVLAYVTQRYGDYVLLKPPVRVDTYALWYGPFAVLALAAAGAFVYLRRRRPVAHVAPAPLSADEEKRLAALLEEEARK
jgi:cytochrome c-type biogenesis protein CcmH